ncbi:MAG: 50S ribosomal protein L1 [Candidatus Bathyarchaeia archaeon]
MSLERQQILDAIEKVKEASPDRNFTESFEMQINLRELDMTRPENRIDTRVQLPNEIEGRNVLVFASGDLALRARRAGADEVVEPDELDEMAEDRKLAKKKLKMYNVFVAEAPMMPTVGRVAGPILGPTGKMPTPVPPQAPIDEIIERERRTVILRSRDRMFVHCIVGKEDMPDEELTENIQAVMRELTLNLERGMGNIKSIYLKKTMGGSVKLW